MFIAPNIEFSRRYNISSNGHQAIIVKSITCLIDCTRPKCHGALLLTLTVTDGLLGLAGAECIKIVYLSKLILNGMYNKVKDVLITPVWHFDILIIGC